MRFIIFIGLILSLTPLFTLSAAETHCSEKDTKTYLSPDSLGLSCGITHGEYKKALYTEPVPDKFTINASAYTAAADECGKSDGITASGNKVKEHHTIACPREYKFGTKIHIEGYGTYICEDRGGAIKGNKFDIYMETKKEAFAFGRRNLIAYIVS